MLIPEKLSISNYCQIKSLEVDFSSHNVFAITASNGRGKTNTLNALRFALSGQASPGAGKLTDDIRDQANEAVVTLEFSLTGGSGHIRRCIGRKNTTCSLRLELNGEVEEYTKTTDAEKRFTSLLGVSPKHISEVIIAEQHSIDALLFWPAAERGPKFQRFLHGEIFSEIEKLAAKERKKVLLDPLAQERLAELEKTHAHETKQLQTAEQALLTTKLYLDSPKVQEIDAKILQIKEFVKHQGEAHRLEQLIKEIKHTNLTGEAQLSQLTMLEESDFSNLEKRVDSLEKAWSQYRPFAQATALLHNLLPQQTQLLGLVESCKSDQNQAAGLGQSIAGLKTLIHYLRKTSEIQGLKAQHEVKKQELTSLELVIQSHVKKLGDLRKEEQKLPLATLHLLQEVFQHMEAGKSTDCIVCGSQIGSARISELRERQQEYTAHHKQLSQEVQVLEKQKQESEKQQNILVGEIAQIQQNLALAQAELPLVPPESLPALTAEKAEAQLIDAQTQQLEILRKKKELPKYEAELRSLEQQINQLAATPPAPEPTDNEQELERLKNQASQERAKRKQAHTIKLQTSKNHGRIEELEAQHSNIGAALRTAGLPALGEEFKLQPNEEAAVTSITQARAVLQSQLNDRNSSLGAVKALDGQMEQARAAISKSKESKEYVSHLEQLEQWFRYSGIPSKIMQRQLNKLCGKMEEIISQFSLSRQFRLTVNEDLEVFMLYADGTIRPIHKASGGERMILGIAFRLATHQYLSPELPFLALDEPSNHLVDTNQVVLQEIIRDLKNSLGKYGIRKLVYCTHSRALANEAEVIINLDNTLRD